MKKRFLVGITGLTLAASAAFGFNQGSSTAAAAPSVQVSVAQQQGQKDGTRAGGVVATVNGTQITVKALNGTSKTIQTTASTTFKLDGAASSLSAVAAGQFLHAQGTTDSAGVFTATVVNMSTTQPQGRPGPGDRGQEDGTRAGGVVATVNGTQITVNAPNGTSKTIQTTASTTFKLDGAASSLSAVAAGQFLHAQGTTDSAGGFTATVVNISTTQPQGRPGPGGRGQADGTRAGGVVATVSGSQITVNAPNGTSKTIQTTASTTFKLDGAASSLSAVAAGQFLHAQGTTDSAGGFTATVVNMSTTQPQGRPGGPRH